ncbi:MAG TPA: radical SAM protein, partial [Rectinemataceae bacterium]
LPLGLPLGVPFGLRLGECALMRRPELSAVPHPDLAWVPAFWASVQDHLFVREEDSTLIIPPNMVYKTNSTGIAILRWLRGGRRIEDFPHTDAERLGQIEAFLRSLSDLCSGRGAAIETVPYDFDFTRLPVLGELAVTYRCGNACRFCYAGCGAEEEGREPGTGGFPEGPAGIDGEMSLEQMKRVVDIFRDEAKIPFFSLTGGEPLLRDELEELIAYAVSRGLRVNLITNAVLASPARAASLFAAGLRTAQVSLESPSARIHDYLCGREGAHERTLAGIAALQGTGISVQTNSTLTRLNRESLLSMPAFLKDLGIERFSMNLFIPPAGAASYRPEAHVNSAELFVPYSEVGSFVDAVSRGARSSGLRFFWYSPTPLCIFNPMSRGLGNKSCAAADGLMHVSPSGDVLPCSSYPESLGNLLTGDFPAIWFSSRARMFKRKMLAPESCKSCESFLACQAACPLYWDYAGLGELEGAPRPGRPCPGRPAAAISARGG